MWDLAERVASEVTAQGSDGHLLDDVVSLAVDLGMSDMLPAIRGWLNQGLLHPRLSDLHKIEHKLAQPLEHRLQDLREGGHGYIRDPETEMAGWPCFKDRPARARQRVQCVTPPPREPAYIFSPPPPTRAQVRESPKIGRNDPCHCGSGKKYKKCHGAA